MTTTETLSLQARIVAALDVDADTIKRARWTAWRFRVTAPFTIRVTNASYGAEAEDHAYEVRVAEVEDDLYVPVVCSCPAAKYNDGDCKHQLAVALAGGTPLIGGAVVFDPARDGDGHDETEHDVFESRSAVVPDGGPRVETSTLAVLLGHNR